MFLLELHEPLNESADLQELRRQLYHYHEKAYQAKKNSRKAEAEDWERKEKNVLQKIRELTRKKDDDK